MKVDPMNRFDAQGRCMLCDSGWLCQPCKTRNAQRERERMAGFSASMKRSKEANIARVCAKYELASDERQSREQKASRIIKENGIFA